MLAVSRVLVFRSSDNSVLSVGSFGPVQARPRLVQSGDDFAETGKGPVLVTDGMQNASNSNQAYVARAKIKDNSGLPAVGSPLQVV
jgi:hypothetical protein